MLYHKILIFSESQKVEKLSLKSIWVSKVETLYYITSWYKTCRFKSYFSWKWKWRHGIQHNHEISRLLDTQCV